MRLAIHPCLPQFGLMPHHPGKNSGPLRRRQVAVGTLHRIDLEHGFVPGVKNVAVWRRMIADIHFDGDAIETSDGGHPMPTERRSHGAVNHAA